VSLAGLMKEELQKREKPCARRRGKYFAITW